MNPIKKCAMIIPATIYSVKFESSLIVEVLTKITTKQKNVRYKSYT